MPPASTSRSPARDVAHRDGDGFLLADENNQPFAARDARIEQITLQHGVVLRHGLGSPPPGFPTLGSCGIAASRHRVSSSPKLLGDSAAREAWR